MLLALWPAFDEEGGGAPGGALKKRREWIELQQISGEDFALQENEQLIRLAIAALAAEDEI